MKNIVVKVSRDGIPERVVNTVGFESLVAYLMSKSFSIVRVSPDSTKVQIREYSGEKKKTLYGNYRDMVECLKIIRAYSSTLSLNKG